MLGTNHVTYSRLTTIFSAPEEIQQACNKSRNYTIENTEYVNTRVLIGNTFAALQPRGRQLSVTSIQTVNE